MLANETPNNEGHLHMLKVNRATVLDHPRSGKVRFADSTTAATIPDRRNGRGQAGRADRCPSHSGGHIGFRNQEGQSNAAAAMVLR
jgi:hypothetical protein